MLLNKTSAQKVVLVTGATGFIGQYVVNHLLQTTDHKIIVAARGNNLPSAWQTNTRLKFKHFDFDNFDEAANYFQYFDAPDTCIHLAWQGLPNYKDLFHFEKNLPQHYRFLKNLIVNGLPSLTVTGTCFEYGMQEGCLSVDMPCQPDNPYALAKYTLYQFLVQLKKRFPFQLNWPRLFYMYGHGQNPKSLYSQLEAAIERGDQEFNMSGGEQERDFLPVETVAENIVNLATSNMETGLVNCCSGVPIKVKDWVENYIQSKAATIKLNLGFYPYADYEPMRFWGKV